MRELGTHEGCIEQTNRLFKDRLYGENACLELDDEKRIRLDDWEMESVVQEKIKQLWPSVNTSNLFDITNFEEYQQEFCDCLGLAWRVLIMNRMLTLFIPSRVSQ